LSCRETFKRLEALRVDPNSIDALIVTHEHSDHIRGAGPLARRLKVPVYMNRRTHENGRKALGEIPDTVSIETGGSLYIADLVVETFTKCHDAADPIGLVLSCNGSRLGLITDLGRSTRLVEDRLKGCQALIVEFNHDVDRLNQGSYPLFLKRRILGPDGHLSNRQACDLVRALAHQGLGVVVPAHLSAENNLPAIAKREASIMLEECGLGRARVQLSLGDGATPLLDLNRPGP
jgi:phosphoribosyl 1,2-cyclic phosphodiesterase